jgi:hypothetical protein
MIGNPPTKTHFIQCFCRGLVLFHPNPEIVISTRNHSQSFHQPQNIAISTEAAHSLIVSSAAEKSASLPQPSTSHHLHLFLPCQFSSASPERTVAPTIAQFAMGGSPQGGLPLCRRHE